MQLSLSPHNRQGAKAPKAASKDTLKRKPQARIVRHNIDDFLDKEALERRLSEIFNFKNTNRLN